jgi:hypothetical protein
MDEMYAEDMPAGTKEKDKRLGRYALYGCGALLALSVCGCIIFAIGSLGLLTYFGQEPENLVVEHSIPFRVEQGEVFDFSLTLTNTGDTEMTIGDIDLDETLGGSILDGTMVIGTNPPMERDFSIPGIKSFHYNRIIAPGESRLVTFQLQAITSGEFGGSVGVYVGDHAKRIDYVGITIVPDLQGQ